MDEIDVKDEKCMMNGSNASNHLKHSKSPLEDKKR